MHHPVQQCLPDCPAHDHLINRRGHRVIPSTSEAVSVSSLNRETRIAIRSLPKDAFVQGTDDDTIGPHLILEGRVKVVCAGPDGKEVVIASLGAGEFFGGNENRFASASVITLEPCRFLILAHEDVKTEFQAAPVSATRVIEQLLRELQERERELAEVQQQKMAISDILRAISKSPADVKSLLEAVVQNAAHLCDATDAGIMQVEGGELRLTAKFGPTPIWPVGSRVPITRGLVTGRSVIDRSPVQVNDLQAAEEEFPEGAATAKKYGAKTTFATPLMRGETALGTIFVRRFEVRPLTDKQIELIVAFADEAAIMIENVRLFNDIQEKSRLLNQQAKELAEWNAALETRVAEQVAQIERLSRLEHELSLAAEIQISMLPRSIPRFEGYQFGARMVPAKYVGGDFFDFIPLGRDALGIAVGDVSDKGLAAALFMAMVRSLLRAEAHPDQSPTEVLRRVNRHLMGMNDKDMFVTIILGTLNRTTREFLYARAGHEAPILSDGSGVIHRLPKCSGKALGVFDDIALEEKTIDLPKGSMMLLYSDGVTDATNSNNERFGSERIGRTIMTCRQLSAQAVCNAILDAVRNHQDNSVQDDDMTAVVVQAL